MNPIKSVSIQLCDEPLLTIHSDGRITVAEHLKPTETAAKVLQIMREQWMADAQATKIREANERIKRLEEELNELRSDEARLLNSNGELERRIKRLLEAGDKMFPWSERVGQEFWTKAKEAKL